MTFKVFVDDNFHFMDESERYELGEFPTLNAAIEASKKIVDEYLLSAYLPGMAAQALFESYTSFGEDPYVVATPSKEIGVPFSAWDYAKHRCDELCMAAPDRDDDG
jgi:hypothetical protein